MTPDLPTFRIVYGEFASVADATVQFWLDDATDTLSERAWGRCYAKACLSYAAHNLALSMNRTANAVDAGDGIVETGASGTVASATADGLSVSFAVPNSATQDDANAYYAQTDYGKRYMALKRECLSRGGLVGCP